MSITAHHHAHLAERRDPTQTAPVRERFLRAIRRRFRALRGSIRRAVGYDQDVFNLRADLAEDDITDFPRESTTERFFVRWLREQVRDGLLEPIPYREVRDGAHWTAAYIRDAYAAGWELANNRLELQGVSVADRDITVALQLPVPTRQLRRLFQRTYRNYEAIAADMVPQIRRTLTQGLGEGVNPREIARRLTDEIAGIQRSRAETLARTEIINSHADATLDRYDRAGVDGVTVSGEFATAGDERVCPICESIEGTVWTIDEMRSATTTFEPGDDDPDHLAGDYPVKPPVHPRCRCAILPVVQ